MGGGLCAVEAIYSAQSVGLVQSCTLKIRTIKKTAAGAAVFRFYHIPYIKAFL